MNSTVKSQLHLGASMYVPTTRDVRNLVEIASGEKYPELRSVIFCTEDAVREDELNAAMENLKQALRKFPEGGDKRPLIFIRVRSPHVLGRCLGFKGIEKVDGFVLPKVTARTLPSYLGELADASRFSLMPTLETCEVLDPKKRASLRDILIEEKVKPRILCLRIGGNDLLRCLNLRRPKDRTIYDTPIGN